ncbi:nitronate monooxygenase [Lactococcus cremoris]|nr:nitronate monooxygenase [Lactococcus cremoris]MDR9866691.1 nitronate monooxygenase [Lactococcus cremoris]
MTWYHQLGIKYPLFQGGMAWATNVELVAAVSNNGALGIIGSGGRTASEL